MYKLLLVKKTSTHVTHCIFELTLNLTGDAQGSEVLSENETSDSEGHDVLPGNETGGSEGCCVGVAMVKEFVPVLLEHLKNVITEMGRNGSRRSFNGTLQLEFFVLSRYTNY